MKRKAEEAFKSITCEDDDIIVNDDEPEEPSPATWKDIPLYFAREWSDRDRRFSYLLLFKCYWKLDVEIFEGGWLLKWRADPIPTSKIRALNPVHEDAVTEALPTEVTQQYTGSFIIYPSCGLLLDDKIPLSTGEQNDGLVILTGTLQGPSVKGSLSVF